MTNWVKQICVHVGSSCRYISYLLLITLQRLWPVDLVRAGCDQRLSGVAWLQMIRSLLGKQHILVQIGHHLLAHGLQALKDVIVVRIGPNLLHILIHIVPVSLNNDLFLLVNLLLQHSSFDVHLRFIESDHVFRIDIEPLAHYDGTAPVYLVQ